MSTQGPSATSLCQSKQNAVTHVITKCGEYAQRSLFLLSGVSCLWISSTVLFLQKSNSRALGSHTELKSQSWPLPEIKMSILWFLICYSFVLFACSTWGQEGAILFIDTSTPLPTSPAKAMPTGDSKLSIKQFHLPQKYFLLTFQFFKTQLLHKSSQTFLHPVPNLISTLAFVLMAEPLYMVLSSLPRGPVPEQWIPHLHRLVMPLSLWHLT